MLLTYVYIIFIYLYTQNKCVYYAYMYVLESPPSNCLFFLKIYLFTFRERGREGEREGEKQQCARDTLMGCLLHAPTGDLAHNLGTCPDLESNCRPLGSQAGAQPTEPHQPGLQLSFAYRDIFYSSKIETLS